MDQVEKSLEQYERIRKGYPQLFADAQKIAKLIIKACKKDYEPSKVWGYLQRLNQIESRKKGYRPVPDMVIDIFLDAKLTNDEERERNKNYYHEVIAFGQLKEYINHIIREI